MNKKLRGDLDFLHSKIDNLNNRITRLECKHEDAWSIKCVSFSKVIEQCQLCGAERTLDPKNPEHVKRVRAYYSLGLVGESMKREYKI